MPFNFTFDPSKEGFRKVLKDYEELALRYVWYGCDEGAISRDTTLYVNEELKKLGDGKGISRSSIINFLDYMAESGVLTYRKETCKGGSRRRYYAAIDESEFKSCIAETLVGNLVRDFPEETMKVAKELGLIE